MQEKKLTIVLFGATGDLAQKKLVPALSYLLEHKHLKHRLSIIGVGRRDIDEDTFRDLHAAHLGNKEILRHLFYHKADISKKDGLSGLRDFLKKKEEGRDANRIFYLATGQEFFNPIIAQLKEQGLHEEKKGFSRVVFEKPFGRDEKSAKAIDACAKQAFKESQIFRVDHYLGKETVQNIFVLRFANTIFEPLWSGEHIANIQLIVDEDTGIGTRGLYYDQYGALKDIVQNHLLQMLAFICMDVPASLRPQDVHKQKTAFLRELAMQKPQKAVFGQYEGYADEPHVKKGSATETFVAMKIVLQTKRMQKVPVYLRTGKGLKRKQAKIIIEFKKEKSLMYAQIQIPSNRLIIHIQPETDIIFELNAKKPAKETIIQKVPLSFCYKCHFIENSPQNYERLLLDIIADDKTLFIGHEELLFAWQFIDRIARAAPATYPQGIDCPKEAKALIEEDGFAWHD